MQLRSNVILFITIYFIICFQVSIFAREKDFDIHISEAELESIQERIEQIDFTHIEKIMAHTETILQSIDFESFEFENFEFPEIPPMPELPPMPVIPEIDIDMPFFDSPDFHGRLYGFHCESSALEIFKDLNEDEKIKIYALRSLIYSQDEKLTLDHLQNIIKNNLNPAMRYEAIHLMRFYLQNENVVSLLCEIAKKDKNIQVRKKAINLLGKCKNDLALKTLTELAK